MASEPTQIDQSEALSSGEGWALERRGSAVWLIFCRPEAMNSLTTGMLEGIEEAMHCVESIPLASVLVITGSGRAFSAGADLTAVPEITDGPHGTDEFRAYLERASGTFHRLATCSFPTIAAINGIALAGGLELASACDIIVASDRARFGDGHAKYGQFPGGGATVRLPLRVGHPYARYLMLSGAIIDSREAHLRGLVDVVAPSDTLIASVERLVDVISASSPLVLRLMKEQTGHSEASVYEALRRELEVAVSYARSADRAEGLAAFTEGRTPRFTGR